MPCHYVMMARLLVHIVPCDVRCNGTSQYPSPTRVGYMVSFRGGRRRGIQSKGSPRRPTRGKRTRNRRSIWPTTKRPLLHKGRQEAPGFHVVRHAGRVHHVSDGICLDFFPGKQLLVIVYIGPGIVCSAIKDQRHRRPVQIVYWLVQSGGPGRGLVEEPCETNRFSVSPFFFYSFVVVNMASSSNDVPR